MIRVEPTPTAQAVARIQAWLAANEKRPREQIAREAGVDAKILRMAAKDGWNPTSDTLQKLEAVIPAGWHPGDPIAANEAA